MTAFMKEAMIKKGIKGSFGLGGITGYFVEDVYKRQEECYERNSQGQSVGIQR